MKSSKIKIATGVLIAAFMFGGCSEPLYVLSPEEENAVVSYASHVVAKYNTYQQDGEIFVMQEILDGEEESEEPVQEEMPEEEEQTEPTEADTQEAEDTQEADSQGAQDEPELSTITEALNLNGVSAEYAGSNLCMTYEKSDIHAVDASFGQQLLVLGVKLTNQDSQEQQLDLLAAKPAFQAIINETETAMAQMTILPNDLSTYQGTILAGESADTVLLFQIPQEIEEVTSLQLKITVNGEIHTVNL